MKFIVGVTLLVIQLSSLRALELEDKSEDSQIFLNNATATLLVDEQTLDGDEYSKIMTKNVSQKNDAYVPVNYVLEKSVIRMKDVEEQPNSKKAEKIIYDIESRHFRKALRKIHGLKDDLQGTMNYVIHKVYNNNEGNLDLILQFVDSNDNVTSSLAVYKSLSYELTLNHHNSHLGRLKLMKSFNNKVIDESSIPADDLNKAEMLKTELIHLTGNSTADELKDALKSNNSAAISTISENIYNNYPVLFLDVMRQILHEAFNEMSKHYLVEFFANHKHASQSVYAYSALFGALIKRNLVGHPLAVTLAFELKKALNEGITDRHAQNVGSIMKFGLPKSVHNLAFAEKVCIVNADTFERFPINEHLFAAGQEYDRDRRWVYTWIRGGSIENGHWAIERHQGAYYIKNEYYIKKKRQFRIEYLHASDIFDSNYPYVPNERLVFTRITGPPNNNMFNWVFIPNGENVYIKNAHFNEYLYASRSKEGTERRKIYTKRTVGKGSLWTIEANCKNN